MKIVFISDIHGISENLNVIDSKDFDNLIILGDIYSNGYDENSINENDKVKDFLEKYKDKLICTKGNCDSDYIFKELGIPSNDNYIKFNDKSVIMYCSHGHNYNSHKCSFSNEDCVVIYGHEHVPYIEKRGNTIYICVGSISKPRYGSPASYCVYDSGTFTLYNVDGQIIDFISK